MTAILKQMLSDERGLETVEWAIIAGLLVSALIAIVIAIGDWVQSQYNTLQTQLGA